MSEPIVRDTNEARQAALVVCDRAADSREAADLLDALGLDGREHTRVWRKQDRSRGHNKPQAGR